MCSKQLKKKRVCHSNLTFKLTFNWNDELWDDWEYLGSTLLKHVKDSLDRQESVWILFLSDSLKEDWQVVMVVELHHIHLPEDLVLGSVLDDVSDRCC